MTCVCYTVPTANTRENAMPDFKYVLDAHGQAKKERPVRIAVEPVPGTPKQGSSDEASFVILNSAFLYDPIDGVLMRTSGPNKGNEVRPSKWGRTMVAGRQRSVFDVVWIMYTGKLPTGRVYPLNGDRTDLRICNLRMEVKV